MVFLQTLRHRFVDEVLHVLHEVGMQIVGNAAYHVVVDDEASAGGLFKNLQHLFAVAETIEECGGSTEVLTQTAEEEDVAVNTLQLVHNRTDNLYAGAHFDAHGLLDTHAERMASLHGSQIVHTVC